jgi:hypothetical protein
MTVRTLASGLDALYLSGTTALRAFYLGTAADRAARGRLNAPGASGGQVQRDGSA